MYSVTFHIGSRRTVHTFWFVNEGKAQRFFDSLKSNTKVKDARLFSIPICDADAYDGSMQEGYIESLEEIYK